MITVRLQFRQLSAKKKKQTASKGAVLEEKQNTAIRRREFHSFTSCHFVSYGCQCLWCVIFENHAIRCRFSGALFLNEQTARLSAHNTEHVEAVRSKAAKLPNLDMAGTLGL